MTFLEKAESLVGKRIQVTTTKGIHTGRMLSTGTDFFIISSIFRRRRIRRIIRIAEIVALFSL